MELYGAGRIYRALPTKIPAGVRSLALQGWTRSWNFCTTNGSPSAWSARWLRASAFSVVNGGGGTSLSSTLSGWEITAGHRWPPPAPLPPGSGGRDPISIWTGHLMRGLLVCWGFLPLAFQYGSLEIGARYVLRGLNPSTDTPWLPPLCLVVTSWRGPLGEACYVLHPSSSFLPPASLRSSLRILEAAVQCRACTPSPPRTHIGLAWARARGSWYRRRLRPRSPRPFHPLRGLISLGPLVIFLLRYDGLAEEDDEVTLPWL